MEIILYGNKLPLLGLITAAGVVLTAVRNRTINYRADEDGCNLGGAPEIVRECEGRRYRHARILWAAAVS
ncbi:hypothetical protein EMIT0158MI4_260005 [Burkholderia ambifaria]